MGNYLGSGEWTLEDVDREVKEAVGAISKEIQRVLQENVDKSFKKAYSKLQENWRKKEEELKRENDSLKSQMADLEKTLKHEKETLQKEREELEKEKDEVLKLSSPSYQTRKMYGDVTPGKKTHEDVSGDFDQFFKRWLRHLPKENKDADSDSIQQALSPLFLDTYNKTCDKVINILSDQMRELFQDPSNDVQEEVQVDISVQERRRDISTAFSLLLCHAKINLEEFNQNLLEKPSTLDSVHMEAGENKIYVPKEALKQLSRITLSMVTQVPPMICSEPIKFNEKIHDIKECKWQESISHYELVYYRPVLFYSIHGAVAARGQVGNRAYPIETMTTFQRTAVESKFENEQDKSLSDETNLSNQANEVIATTELNVENTLEGINEVCLREKKESHKDRREKGISNNTSSEKSQNSYQFNEEDEEQLPEHDKTSEGSLNNINENSQLEEDKNDIRLLKLPEVSDDDKAKTKTKSIEIELLDITDIDDQKANHVNKFTKNDKEAVDDNHFI